MEYIFTESVVLASLADQPLTVEYIITNYRDIIPDIDIIENLKTDFEKLYNNELPDILELEILTTILHKYKIKKYYEQMLEHLIWKILRLELKPNNLCSDILHDMINFNNDFKNILNILIYQEANELQNNDTTNKNLCSPQMAIKYGLFDTLKYLVKVNGCDNTQICFFAAEYGNFDILKWGHENNFEWDKNTCATAAFYEHFEILKWLHENGCPWNVMVCINATKKNNFDILKWAYQNGCPLSFAAFDEAGRLGNNDMQDWILTQLYNETNKLHHSGIPMKILLLMSGCGNLTYSS